MLLFFDRSRLSKKTLLPISLFQNFFCNFIHCLSFCSFSEEDTLDFRIKLRHLTLAYRTLLPFSPSSPLPAIPHNSSCSLCFSHTSLLSVPLIKLFLVSGLCICLSLCLEYCPLLTPKLLPATDTHAHQLIYIHPQVSTYRSLSCKSFSMTLVILTHGLLDCFFRA